MLAGVVAGAGVWVGVRGEACLGIWLKVGPLAVLETEGWRQVVELWALLREGTGVTGIGEGAGVGVRVWVGVTGVMVCEGLWEGVGVRVRVV